MKKNEIKRTIEEVIRVEYIAEDGTVFYNEAEAKKHEESALFAVSKRLKRLSDTNLSQYDLFNIGNDDERVEIFDVQTEEDLEVLRRYLYLTMAKNGASEKTIEEAFTDEKGSRADFVFDNVTIGHEVIIFWGYDEDWFWVYKDGSLEGYFNWLREKYTKAITPKENN